MDKMIGFELKGIGNLIHRDIQELFHEVDKNVTPMHAFVIHRLIKVHHGSIAQKDFEDEFMMRRSTASRMIQLMEKNDFLKRVSDPDDGRSKKIEVTEKAKDFHEKIKQRFLSLDTKMKQNISDEELNTFFNVIYKIKTNLES